MEGMPQFKDLALREVAALQYQKGRRLETGAERKACSKTTGERGGAEIESCSTCLGVWKQPEEGKQLCRPSRLQNEATATGAALPAALSVAVPAAGWEFAICCTPLPIGTSSQTQFAKTSGGSPFKGVEKEKQPASAPAAHEAPTATASQLQVACIHPGRRAWLDECPEITIKVTRRELPPYPARDESWEDAQMWTCLECKECSAICSHTADESRKMARCTKFRNKTCAWAQFFSYP